MKDPRPPRLPQLLVVLAGVLGGPGCDVLFGVEAGGDGGGVTRPDGRGGDGDPGGGDADVSTLPCAVPGNHVGSQLLCLEFTNDPAAPPGVVDSSTFNRPTDEIGVVATARDRGAAQDPAARFNTTSSLWVTEEASLDLSEAFTLATWARLDQEEVEPGSGLIHRAGQYAMYVGPSGVNDGQQLRCTVRPLGGLFTVTAGGVASGTWHFLACTWNGTALCAYVDDAQPECGNTGALKPAGAGNLAVGHGSNGVARIDPLTGALDRVQILCEALSRDEVTQVWAAR